MRLAERPVCVGSPQVVCTNVVWFDLVKKAPGYPVEVHIAKPLRGDITSDRFGDFLDEVVIAFLELTKKAGGLRAAIIG